MVRLDQVLLAQSYHQAEVTFRKTEFEEKRCGTCVNRHVSKIVLLVPAEGEDDHEDDHETEDLEGFSESEVRQAISKSKALIDIMGSLILTIFSTLLDSMPSRSAVSLSATFVTFFLIFCRKNSSGLFLGGRYAFDFKICAHISFVYWKNYGFKIWDIFNSTEWLSISRMPKNDGVCTRVD